MRSLAGKTWLLHLLTIGCCAFFAARATGQLVAGLLDAPATPPSQAGLPAAQRLAAEALPPRSVEAIVGRNIFCSTCERGVEEPVNSGAAAASSGAPVRTPLKLQLLATLVSEEDPSSSVAYILDTERNQTRLYGVGARVGGEAVIIEVSARQVLLLHGGHHEFLPLGEGSPAEGQPRGSAPVASAEFAMPEPMSGLEGVADGIRRVGGSRYSIQRSMVNKVLSDPSILGRSARLVPATQDGQPNGFTVYARPGSLPSLLGLFNGDVLQGINGHPITTPDKALEVLQSMRSASHLSLSFTRKGVTLTHDYDIR